MVSLMVGGAVESQMDKCLSSTTAVSDAVSSDGGQNYTTSSFMDNGTTTMAAALNVSTTTAAGPAEMSAEELKCRLATATTLTLLVGLCQVCCLLRAMSRSNVLMYIHNI